METMTLNAAPQWRFSGEQGKANYERALREYPAQAIVDLAALRDNMRHLVEVCGGPESGTAVMGVVKADAYGHGLIPSALAALAGGATWLGTAQAREALLLRKAGIGLDRCRILTWMYSGPTAPLDELIANDIDVSVGSLDGIEAVAAAARATGRTAYVHVKVDSGFGRNGFTEMNFPDAVARLVPLAEEGLVRVVGQWSHLAVADAPDVPEFVAATDRQIENFNAFTELMKQAGIAPQIRHLANTAATLDRPEIRFELTRPGIGLYGYEPDPAMGTPAKYRLKPAMTLQAQLGTVKDVEAGHGISYGRTYLTGERTSDRADRVRGRHPPLRLRLRRGGRAARGQARWAGAGDDRGRAARAARLRTRVHGPVRTRSVRLGRRIGRARGRHGHAVRPGARRGLRRADRRRLGARRRHDQL